MKKVFLALGMLCLLPSPGRTANFVPAQSVYNGKGILGSIGSDGNSMSVSNVLTPIIITNGAVFAQTVTYSNSVTSGTDPIPAIQPFGGVYTGLRITNALVGGGLYQACFGFPAAQTFANNFKIEVRDSVFWSESDNGDAVSWKTFGATNNVYFYDCIFRAGRYCFNQVGVENLFFKGCDFLAMCGANGFSVGFVPDQGPTTNIFNGCNFLATSSAASATPTAIAACLVHEIHGFGEYNSCHFSAISTNAQNMMTCLAFSAEGDYVVIFNQCYFKLGGPGTNTVMDTRFAGQTSAGANCFVFFNDCFVDGTTGESGGKLIFNNGIALPTVTVRGGNISPSLFSTLTNVTFDATANPYSTFGNTNLGTAAIDFSIPNAIIPTAVGLTFTAAVNVDTTGQLWQHCSRIVTNSAAGTITLAFPAGVVSSGSTTVTRRSRVDFDQYGQKFTNAVITTIN